MAGTMASKERQCAKDGGHESFKRAKVDPKYMCVLVRVFVCTQ